MYINPKSGLNTCFIECIRKYIEINKPLFENNKIAETISNLTKFHKEVSIKMVKEFENLMGIKINIFYMSKDKKEEENEDEYNKLTFKTKDDLCDKDSKNGKDFKNSKDSESNKDDNKNATYTRIYPKTQRNEIEKDCNLLFYKKHYFLITNLFQFFNVKKFKCYNCFCDFESRADLNGYLFFAENLSL